MDSGDFQLLLYCQHNCTATAAAAVVFLTPTKFALGDSCSGHLALVTLLVAAHIHLYISIQREQQQGARCEQAEQAVGMEGRGQGSQESNKLNSWKEGAQEVSSWEHKGSEEKITLALP